ncbi:MAG: SDR family oxidoreductase [Candidatus Eisenbacteria bacterium]|uniref:SDR family oxidoreductase n=1 Tax=Eiseniibacteriota bacterium TaxID=2212470 RepID=A0A538TKV3_UNCEI|nr:MAG: SDR family oxidoreductase [Candidatus Eisenbacteria bacterium]
MALYLVTGGAGFIGSHIAARLLKLGHHVRVLDNLSTGRKSNLDAIREEGPKGKFEWLEGDLRSLPTCQQACEGVEYVLHEAALASVERSIRNPVESTEVNVGGLVNLLVAARERGVRRVVLASSSSVYGDTPTLPKHEDMVPHPLSPYAASKLAGEHFASVYQKSLGLSTVCLRYFNVFGPRQDPKSEYAAVIPRFVTALLRKERPIVFGDGGQTRDFTFIDNVVQANLDACTRPEAGGQSINIAAGEQNSLLQLLEQLGSILGVKADPEFRPPRAGDVRDSFADVSRATRLLGYAPAVNFRDGLTRTVEYYRSGGA